MSCGGDGALPYRVGHVAHSQHGIGHMARGCGLCIREGQSPPYTWGWGRRQVSSGGMYFGRTEPSLQVGLWRVGWHSAATSVPCGTGPAWKRIYTKGCGLYFGRGQSPSPTSVSCGIDQHGNEYMPKVCGLCISGGDGALPTSEAIWRVANMESDIWQRLGIMYFEGTEPSPLEVQYHVGNPGLSSGRVTGVYFKGSVELF